MKSKTVSKFREDTSGSINPTYFAKYAIKCMEIVIIKIKIDGGFGFKRVFLAKAWQL